MSDISCQSFFRLALTPSSQFAFRHLRELLGFRDVRTNFAFVMESVYVNYKPMSDLIIGRIDNNMVIGHHIAITSDKIITHVDVLSVLELHYRNLKEPLVPIILILAINETSDVLSWV